MKKLTIIKKIINAGTYKVQTLYYAASVSYGQIWVNDITQVLLMTNKEAVTVMHTLDCENNYILFSKIKPSQVELVTGYDLGEPIIRDKQIQNCTCGCNGSYSQHRKNRRGLKAVESTNHLPDILREQAQ
jgi:hypothetical protein